MMEKLLHERLRELENWCQLYERYNIREVSFTKLMESFADEIERYYIPRPRFEDGEPIQWGELFRGYNVEACDLAAFTVSSDGHYTLNGYSGDCDFHIESYSDFVKRPTPIHHEHDSLERIKDDATMLPYAYCLKHGIGLSAEPDMEDATIAMVRDLLRRQMEVLK